MLGRRTIRFQGRGLFALAALLAMALLGVALTAVAGPISSTTAGEKKKAAAKEAQRGPLDTRLLFGLSWHDDWKAAVTKNRVEPRKARPIFFLRILGDLAKET